MVVVDGSWGLGQLVAGNQTRNGLSQANINQLNQTTYLSHTSQVVAGLGLPHWSGGPSWLWSGLLEPRNQTRYYLSSLTVSIYILKLGGSCRPQIGDISVRPDRLIYIITVARIFTPIILAPITLLLSAPLASTKLS
jgi:hypothetical protein